MNDVVSPPLFSRILCGEHGVGSVEWRGMHMLVISYGQAMEDDRADKHPIAPDVDGGDGQTVSGGRRHGRSGDAADDLTPASPSAPETSMTVTPESSSQTYATPLTRDDVLESLHKLTASRLRARQAAGREGRSLRKASR
ncbi:hypothetical protein [Bifidobacterium miconisargentati]|uniref:hypothetical protein n=1 Tax=Bifidobacterium miconisargentati TaxID=2834437 RepID=UPI001BDD72DC|nr:hypothetical protein [Bifidobacterium miconisargentati]MBW3090109.1 hypothetical protein [Bifidobacterium miconisargentati]